MKKLITTTLTILLIGYASVAQDSKTKKSDATVEQVLGMYVFVDSVPKADYQFLGSVGAGSGLGKAMVGAAEYDAKKMRLIKKMREEYPNADGIIIHFTRGGKDTADAIKFKE